MGKENIKLLMAELEWEVEIIKDPKVQIFNIITKSQEKRHIIRIRKEEDKEDLNFAHELIHAYLAEKVAPVFGVGGFKSEQKPTEEDMFRIYHIVGSVVEYFVEMKLIQFLGKEVMREKYMEGLEVIKSILSMDQSEKSMLLIMDAVPIMRDLGLDISFADPYIILLKVSEIIQPAEPSLEILEEYSNSLLKVFGLSVELKVSPKEITIV
ncbi:hypothetical protein [Desulfonatronovibrio magnus]|uniref:hypothetical protein n=1 Tax=Desulfonatronovibrio magnus TaxID=698827 RepID=UPI0005EBBB71|nr:hypothetical protein [Desulfonatronovibrio magnus]